MTREKNFAYFDRKTGVGYLTLAESGAEISTMSAQCDRYIRIDDRRQYPQLCAGGSRRGNTLIWSKEPETLAQHFARDCDARLYKTRRGYDKARRGIAAEYAAFNAWKTA